VFGVLRIVFFLFFAILQQTLFVIHTRENTSWGVVTHGQYYSRHGICCILSLYTTIYFCTYRDGAGFRMALCLFAGLSSFPSAAVVGSDVSLSLPALCQHSHVFFVPHCCALTSMFQPCALVPGEDGAAHSELLVEGISGRW